MDKGEIVCNLKGMVADILEIDPNSILPSDNIVSDLGADSLQYIDILVSVEQEFCIDIKNGYECVIIGDMANYVRDRICLRN